MKPALDPPALRPHGGAMDGAFSDDAPRVLRVDPWDGATTVFGDAPVVITLSHAADGGTLDARTVRICAGGHAACGHVTQSPDGRVVIWTPETPLARGLQHTVEVSGVRDRRGREVLPHRSAFTVALRSLDELLETRFG
jgi:hypothetical protein